MGVNIFVFGGEVKFDISDSTITADMLPPGVVAYNALGERMVGAKASYTNLLPLAIDADGKIYDAADGKPGYKSGVRLSSSGAETIATAFDTTGFIPCKLGDIVRMRGINYSPTSTNASSHRICFYKADKTYIQLSQASTPSSTPDPNLDGVYNSDNKLIQFTVKNYATVDLTDVAYFRICSDAFDDNPIITVNEEIT
jgi:hypothetical protein